MVLQATILSSLMIMMKYVCLYDKRKPLDNDLEFGILVGNRSIQFVSSHLSGGAEERAPTRNDSKSQASADNEQSIASKNGTRHTCGACKVEMPQH
jgi:hypothetical protein